MIIKAPGFPGAFHYVLSLFQRSCVYVFSVHILNALCDKVTCKYRAESYTFLSSWYTGLTTWIKGDGSSFGCFYTKNGNSWVNVADALAAYKPTMQQFLDEAYAYRNI